LGGYGDTFPLFFGRVGTEAFEQTCAWWGREKVVRGMGNWSADSDDAPAPDYHGLTHMALREGAPNAKLAGGAVEFGTLPVDQIGQVVFLDHWLLYKSPPEIDTRFWRAQMRTMMAPREMAWERSVLMQAERLYALTIAGLARWV
jgi:hypothetical protein